MFFHLPKNVPNHYPEHYPHKIYAQDSDLAHFLGDGAKMKKKSDLNPPLLRSQLKCFRNLVKLRRTILGLNIYPFSCKNLPFFGPDLTNNLDRNATFYLHP